MQAVTRSFHKHPLALLFSFAIFVFVSSFRRDAARGEALCSPLAREAGVVVRIARGATDGLLRAARAAPRAGATRTPIWLLPKKGGKCRVGRAALAARFCPGAEPTPRQRQRGSDLSDLSCA
jgi:hypothetical protein